MTVQPSPPSESVEVNPFAEALDYLWGELTPEQVRSLPPEIKQACQANHEALNHPPPWTDLRHNAPSSFASCEPLCIRGEHTIDCLRHQEKP